MPSDEAREKRSRQLLWASLGGIFGIALCTTVYAVAAADANGPMRIIWGIGMFAVGIAMIAGFAAIRAQRKKLDAAGGQ